MSEYKNPNLIVQSNQTKSDSVSWRSPSNIAIVKYWGKHGVQLPLNPSISFTLQAAHTNMVIDYSAKKETNHNVSLDFFFEKQQNEAFKTKIQQFLESLVDIFPFLRQLQLTIHSNNSFPHSAGIASSASAMSALALCLCEMERQLFSNLKEETIFLQKASYISRLGSGSACRSVYPKMAVWGKNTSMENASDLYAVPFNTELHDVFKNYQDTILLVSRDEKEVSSRAGHGLMEGNIFANSRYGQARQNFRMVIEALKTGDVALFGQIAEQEALTLHALMMTSNPPYILMKPNSLLLIEKVRAYRQETKIPLYFTLDAGPNLHLLYPESNKVAVMRFIQSELVAHCEDGQIIEDRVGEGAVKMG